MRAAIYCRVSSTQQSKEGDSISAQLDALRKYIRKYSYECVGEFVDDGISGTKYSERDELQRLMELVEADKVDIICFTKLDRWFRSIKHYINIQSKLDEHNVAWLAIWEPIYDTTTPQGRQGHHKPFYNYNGLTYQRYTKPSPKPNAEPFGEASSRR